MLDKINSYIEDRDKHLKFSQIENIEREIYTPTTATPLLSGADGEEGHEFICGSLKVNNAGRPYHEVPSAYEDAFSDMKIRLDKCRSVRQIASEFECDFVQARIIQSAFSEYELACKN